MTPIPPRPIRVGSLTSSQQRFAALGDSTVGANSSEASVSSGFYGNDWPTILTALSQGRFVQVYNGGVSGNKTGQILARVPDVVAARPQLCFVLGGANDAGGDPPLAESKANLAAIYRKLIGAGIQPIALTQMPHSVAVSNTQQRNGWIKAYCARHKIPVIDLYAVLCDPVTGQWNTDYSDDGVHPNNAGRRLVAETILTAMGHSPMPFAPILCTSQTDAFNMLTNGTFAVDSNADGVADNWAKQSSGGTHTYSVVSDPTNVVGNWQQDAVSGAGLTYLNQARFSGFSIGDTILLAGKWATANAVAGSLQPQAKVIFGGAGVSRGALYLPIVDIATWGYFSVEGVVPPGTTNLEVQLYAQLGTGTIRWGQVTLVNLTVHGVV